MDLFGPPTTTLRHPVWYSNSIFESVELPLERSHYKVTPGEGRDGRWIVTSSKGDVVYNGIGPATVVAA